MLAEKVVIDYRYVLGCSLPIKEMTEEQYKKVSDIDFEGTAYGNNRFGWNARKALAERIENIDFDNIPPVAQLTSLWHENYWFRTKTTNNICYACQQNNLSQHYLIERSNHFIKIGSECINRYGIPLYDDFTGTRTHFDRDKIKIINRENKHHTRLKKLREIFKLIEKENLNQPHWRKVLFGNKTIKKFIHFDHVLILSRLAVKYQFDIPDVDENKKPFFKIYKKDEKQIKRWINQYKEYSPEIQEVERLLTAWSS